MITAAQRTRFEARAQCDRDQLARGTTLLVEMTRALDGGGWAIVQEDHMRYLERDGKRLLVRADLQKRRLQLVGVTPRLPQNAPYRVRAIAPSITVSIDRSAVAVARDIERRLLPKQAEALAEQAQSVAKWQASTDSLDAFAQRLATAAGSSVDAIGRGSGRDYRRISLYTGKMAITGKVEIGSATTARFEISVSSAANAERIAALLGELNTKKGES